VKSQCIVFKHLIKDLSEMIKKANQQRGVNPMSSYDFDIPPPNDASIYLPKGVPNIQFNELIVINGEVFRNPIGLSHSNIVIDTPIISETHLGLIEVVSLPATLQDAGSQHKMPSRKAAYPAKQHHHKKLMNPFCLFQQSLTTH
jgi:hypothetical protein